MTESNITEQQVEETISQNIYVIRNRRVMIDADLAKLYSVATKTFNRAIKRNIRRFPDDFMFQLTESESMNRYQFGTGSQKHRDPRFLPYTFTEHGVAMLSSVLNSERAVQMNIFIVRAFIKMRESLELNKDLAIKVDEIERKQNDQGRVLATVNNVVKQLISKPNKAKNKVGFNLPPQI